MMGDDDEEYYDEEESVQPKPKPTKKKDAVEKDGDDFLNEGVKK